MTIRLNIDRHNASDFLALAEILGGEFKGESRLNVYSHVLFEAGAEGTAVRHTAPQRRDLFQVRMRLQERLRELGLFRPKPLPHSLKLNNCMADNDGNVLILPDGRLGKCEHYTEDHWFGSLDSPEREETVLAGFKLLREEIEACAECAFYPDCYRLDLCEEAAHCYPEKREEMLLDARQALLSFCQKNESDEESD